MNTLFGILLIYNMKFPRGANWLVITHYLNLQACFCSYYLNLSLNNLFFILWLLLHLVESVFFKICCFAFVKVWYSATSIILICLFHKIMLYYHRNGSSMDIYMTIFEIYWLFYFLISNLKQWHFISWNSSELLCILYFS